MSVFAKGILATVVVIGALFGMVYLLMSMVLGAKLAYWVEASVTFGVTSIMSFIWLISALGPVGAATAWQPIAIGPSLTSASFAGTTYNVGDYPNMPPWVKPTIGKYLADLNGADDLAAEQAQVQTAMDGALGDALSPVPGVLALVKPYIKGQVNLQTGHFTETEILMKPATVKGKASIIAEGKGVPSEAVSVTSLPGQTGSGQTATIVQYLVHPGDSVTAGEPVMAIKNSDGSTGQLTTSDYGVVAALGPTVGSLIRPGVPIVTLDISSHPNEPSDVEIVAVRVRGSLHTPAAIYLLVSLILFVIHLTGLSRLEKGRKRGALIGQPT